MLVGAGERGSTGDRGSREEGSVEMGSEGVVEAQD